MVTRIGATASAPAAATAFQLSSLPTHQAGDRLVLFVAGKPDTTTIPTINSGWTLVGSGTGGTGSQAADTGAVFFAVYAKDATSSAETTPTITPGGTAPSSWVTVCVCHRPAASHVWADDITTNAPWVNYVSDTATATPLTGTMPSFTSCQPTAGDAIFGVGIVPTDSVTALGAATLTATGLSGGSINTTSTNRIKNTLGNDCGLVWTGWVSFTGTATAGLATSLTLTTSSNHSGAIVMAVLREKIPDPPHSGTASGGIYWGNLVDPESSNLEGGTLGSWTTGGGAPPTLTNSSAQAHSGTHSLLATWASGGIFNQATLTGIVPTDIGVTYVASTWVYVPTGSSNVALVFGGQWASDVTVKDQWALTTKTFTATGTTTDIQLIATVGATTAGTQTWIDDTRVDISVMGAAIGYAPTLPMTGAAVGEIRWTGTAGVLNRAALIPYYAAVANRNAQQANIVFIGDSITEGAASLDWLKRFQYLLKQQVQANYPVTGVATPGLGWMATTAAFLSPGPLLTEAGAPAQLLTDYGLGLKAKAYYTGQSVTYNATVCDRIRVTYATKSSAAGQGTISIDGADVATITSVGASNAGGKIWDSGALTSASHVLAIRGINAAGSPLIVSGVEFCRGDYGKGIHTYDAGHWGLQASDFLTAGAIYGHWKDYQSIHPDLTVINLGTNNDWTNPTQMLSDLDALIALCDSNSDRGDGRGPRPILLFVPYRAWAHSLSGTEISGWTTYVAGVLARATGHVAVYDLSAYWPALAAGGGYATHVMYEDATPVHPNEFGHKLYADLLLTALAPTGGSNLHSGTGNGAIGWVGQVFGKNIGRATGTIAWVGSSTGKKYSKGQNITGTISWVGSARGANRGAPSGSIAWVGSATGSKPSHGQVLGAVGWIGSATGAKPVVSAKTGAGAGAVGWVGSATGKSIHQGLSTDSYITWKERNSTFGVSYHYSPASGAISWVGTASGSSPLVGVKSGQGLGNISWVGSATGAVQHRGSTTGTLTWTGAGFSQDIGRGTGSVAWVGNATGLKPTVAAKTGASTGAVSWVGSSTGKRLPHGASTGAVAWVGSGTGKRSPLGSGVGTLHWAGAVFGVDIGRATGAIGWVGVATGLHPAMNLSITLNELVGITDTGSVAGTAATIAEDLGLTDTVSTLVTVPILLTLAEELGLTDAGDVRNAWVTIAETVGVTESLVPLKIGVNTGSAARAITWAGSATGARTSKGAVTGTISWVGSSRGANRGGAYGSLSFVGAATGLTPAVGMHIGFTNGAVTWVGISTGARRRLGSATGTIRWIGIASASGVRVGLSTGILHWTGTAQGHLGPYVIDPWRIQHIYAESRVAVIIGEQRIMYVPAEDRTTPAYPDPRILVVAAESRVYSIPSEERVNRARALIGAS